MSGVCCLNWCEWMGKIARGREGSIRSRGRAATTLWYGCRGSVTGRTSPGLGLSDKVVSDFAYGSRLRVEGTPAIHGVAFTTFLVTGVLRYAETPWSHHGLAASNS